MADRLRTLGAPATLGRRALLGGAFVKLGDAAPADVDLDDRTSVVQRPIASIVPEQRLGSDLVVGPPPPPPIVSNPDAGDGPGDGGPGGDGSGDGDGGGGGGEGDGTGTGPGGPGGAE